MLIAFYLWVHAVTGVYFLNYSILNYVLPFIFTRFIVFFFSDKIICNTREKNFYNRICICICIMTYSI